MKYDIFDARTSFAFFVFWMCEGHLEALQHFLNSRRLIMGKRKIKKSHRLPPFVPLTWDMLNSEAYKDLKPSTTKALPHFLGKYRGPFNDPEKFKHEFPLTYAEAEKMIGIAASTFHSVICDLIAKGFIEPVKRGGLRGCGKSCSSFKLSNRWIEYGRPAFEEMDWKKFLPGL